MTGGSPLLPVPQPAHADGIRLASGPGDTGAGHGRPAEHDYALRMMEATDAGTGLMHEGFDADDPARFTRPWFSWANALYCGLVLASLGIDPVP